MLQARAPVMYSIIVFTLMRFRPFLTVHTNYICMRFRFDSLSRAFLNGYVFRENAQRISVEGRHERIQMYAFSNNNALMWTGPNNRATFARKNKTHFT